MLPDARRPPVLAPCQGDAPLVPPCARKPTQAVRAQIHTSRTEPHPPSQGTPKDLRKLEDARERVGFRRGADGRVSLLSDGEEFEVKADAQAPGFLLLRCVDARARASATACPPEVRSVRRAVCCPQPRVAAPPRVPLPAAIKHTAHVPGCQPCFGLSVLGLQTLQLNPRLLTPPPNSDSRGYCYYLPPDPSGRLRQIDLSDDVLVAQLFANGMWQEIVEPVEVLKAPKGGAARGWSRAALCCGLPAALEPTPMPRSRAK
jgi:hypothetical protein